MKSSVNVLALTRCSLCGGSWLSSRRYRMFSDYRTEDKSTHFGFEKVSEQEKTEKGKNHKLIDFFCVFLLFSCY